jgi:23S rRNA (uridine2552-2'-O)-methyltransferase
LPEDWIRRRKRDYYYRKAKEEDLRSRASFKLLQAVEKFGFMRVGDVVVDLGAAPGGWLQASRRIVGESGFVLGVDIAEIEPLGYPNVIAIKGDIRSPQVIRRIIAILPRPADVVLSDASPNISGTWEVDHARQIELAEAALKIAVDVLRSGGNFFVKIFQGDLQAGFLESVRGFFRTVRTYKPRASRKESAETYVLGMRLKRKDEG